jgi:hypothetical protein
MVAKFRCRRYHRAASISSPVRRDDANLAAFAMVGLVYALADSVAGLIMALPAFRVCTVGIVSCRFRVVGVRSGDTRSAVAGVEEFNP